jgi:hypothetical protein
VARFRPTLLAAYKCRFRDSLQIDPTPKTRLKTGADELKLEKHHGRAEFFALPIAPFEVALSPIRPFAGSQTRPTCPIRLFL